MMKEFYSNIDPTRKNFLIVSVTDGRARIIHDCPTEEELTTADYHDFVAIDGLEVGESCKTADGADIVVRIA